MSAPTPKPSVAVTAFGQVSGAHHTGETQVDCYTLDGGSGLTVEVLTYGAHTRRVRLNTDVGPRDLTLYLDTIAEYEDETANPFLGALVGRYANRIADGRFRLGSAGHQVPANDPPHALHGGPLGFARRVWDAAAIADDQRASVRLTYASPDGEQGFPGNLDAAVTYWVEGTTLGIDIEATTDAPTPVNLTNHAYWNLEGPESSSVADHQVWIDADRVVTVDAEAIPTGNLDQVDGPLDFRTERPIGPLPAADIGQQAEGFNHDHCLVLSPDPELGAGEQRVRRFATIRSTDGLTMTLATGQAGVQFYTGSFLAGNTGGGSRPHVPGTAFCLETQAFPDSPNRPNFPDTILAPGETYRSHTTITLSADRTR